MEIDAIDRLIVNGGSALPVANLFGAIQQSDAISGAAWDFPNAARVLGGGVSGAGLVWVRYPPEAGSGWAAWTGPARVARRARSPRRKTRMRVMAVVVPEDGPQRKRNGG